MNKINELIQELGISKVKLAKYLGVSRQMVYNYLEMESIETIPKEKKNLLLKLFGLEPDSKENEINKIVVDSDFIEQVESRLNSTLKTNCKDNEVYFDMKGLSKEEQTLVNDLTFLIKEKFTEEKNNQTYYIFLYLYHLLQSIDNIPEIKYIFAYMSKANGFIDPDEFKFDENGQFMLESILFTALNLYNNGSPTKSKLAESHRRFVDEIKSRNEEKLSRTQQLNTVKIQALKELGYTEINNDNASEVFEKIAEIEGRKAF